MPVLCILYMTRLWLSQKRLGGYGDQTAVQCLKTGFGKHSCDGERFTERILTVTKTCQMRQRNPFPFLSYLMGAVKFYMDSRQSEILP